jgi:outer membrane immunogenic protein
LIVRRLQCALLAAVAVIGFGSIASAADMAVKAVPAIGAAPVVQTWTGWYVGAHVGWGWATHDYTSTNGTGLFPVGFVYPTLHGNGVLGGLQGGYNYQFGSWVVGIEGEYTWSDLHGSGTTAGVNVVPSSSETNLRNKWMATVAGRLGYSWADWLLFVKAGAVWGGFEENMHDTVPTVAPGFGIASGSETRVGWTIGIGGEWLIPTWKAWSVKAEYDYVDFGSKTVDRIVSVGSPASIGADRIRSERTTEHLVKLGLNYHFNFR